MHVLITLDNSTSMLRRFDNVKFSRGLKASQKTNYKILLFTAETYYLNIKHLMKCGGKEQCTKSKVQRKFTKKKAEQPQVLGRLSVLCRPVTPAACSF